MPSADPAFLWGVATSAYQIEGGRVAGKGESIWDRFSHQPGRVLDRTNGDTACDHYRRFREDVELMAELGIRSYRFSIAWTRIHPDGGSDPAHEGLAFYSNLVDALHEHDIEPLPTLYHWDLPQALEDGGGWRNRATIDAFARYSETVVDALGDRVSTWVTHNEPWVAAFLGHLEGIHAPGVTDWYEALLAAHHMLVSHGRAARRIRALAPDARVGIALDCRPSRPVDDSEEARRAQQHFDGFRNRWFFDPVFGRGYPADMLEAYRERGRFSDANPSWVHDGDLEEIAAPIDFLGVNYYTSLAIRPGFEERDDPAGPIGPNPPPGYTEMGWENTPQALTDFLLRVHRDYAPASILVTENGASYSDGPVAGTISDDRRISYLAAHIEAVAAARAAGSPVDGYYVWSLLDNFEWALGYTQRFGIVWVNHATGERIPKASFDWYRRRISAGI